MIDEKAAGRVIRFIERYCSYPKGSWSETNRFVLRPWQRDIIRPLFGELLADGSRRYRKAYISFARKNGKTTLVACLGLYLLMADGERAGEIAIGANDREQAGITFRAAESMVRADQTLSRRCRIIPTRKEIIDTKTGSVLKAVSCDVPSKLGMDLSAWIYDELAFAPNRQLYDVLNTSTGSRRQPLGIIITTAGWNVNGVGYDVYRYACDVRDGVKLDDGFLPIIYETVEPNPEGGTEGHDWQDGDTWALANPALADFRSLADMRQLAREAANDPGNLVAFKTLYLNRWLQSSAAAFIDYARWELCRAPAGFILEDTYGRAAYGGLDLSATTDLSAFVFCVPLDGLYVLVPWIFLPDDDLRGRSSRDGVDYGAWRDSGALITTAGPVVDYERIKSEATGAAKQWDLRRFGFDPWNATRLVQELTAAGLPMVEIRQGYRSLSPGTKSFQGLVLQQKIRHSGNPVLDWAVRNMVVTQDPAGNIKPDKEKSTHRIDPAVAAIMAVDLAERDRPKGPSVYERRGPLVLE